MTSQINPGQVGNPAYPSSTYRNNLSSTSVYPTPRQDLVNSFSAGVVANMRQAYFSSTSISSKEQPKKPSMSTASNFASHEDDDNSTKDSSEESEDIRPCRHALNDKTNDLHPDNKIKEKEYDEYKKYHSTSRSSKNVDRKKGKEITVTYSNSTSLFSKKDKTSVGKTTVTDYLSQLKNCVETLKSSGWYWGSIGGEQAMDVVSEKGMGAFLIRDSTHQKFLFTLTVYTANGPTNVRIVYRQGLFGLDCDNMSQVGIKFDCVVKMISHYVNNSKKYKRISDKREKLKKLENEDKNSKVAAATTAPAQESSNTKHKSEKSQDALDNSAADNSIALLLLLPCRKEPPTLQHTARIALNKKLAKRSSKNAGLKLENLISDTSLIAFCKKYPYTV